jgi:hypothetical protein
MPPIDQTSSTVSEIKDREFNSPEERPLFLKRQNVISFSMPARLHIDFRADTSN